MSTCPTIEPSTDEYYVKLFVENPAWSTASPNADETARWLRISALLQSLPARAPMDKPRRILEVGCGRGWLTKLVSAFGQAEGVEPVASVVDQARQLFPEFHFTTGTAETILDSNDFQPYDLVITSEVIEHIPRDQKPGFIRNLARLLKPGGHVVLTTPRGESLQEWTRLAGDPSQPVEDWICEPELRELFTQANFAVTGHDRVLFDTAALRFVTADEAQSSNDLIAIYQVWAFQLPESNPAWPAPSVVTPDAALAEFHRACRDAADRALQFVPDHPLLLTARASALLALGELEAARKLLAWTVALHANDPAARRLFADALSRLGLLREADAQSKRAAELAEAAQHGGPARSFSFLNHLREAKLLEGAPAQLEIRHASIHRVSGPCIYLHPPARLRFVVPSAEPGRFTCAIAIQPEAWNQPTAGGCEFSLRLNGREVLRREINPRLLNTDRCWHEIEIEVPPAPGPFHEFIFRTLAIGSPPDFRWALWRDPIFRPQTATNAKLP